MRSRSTKYHHIVRSTEYGIASTAEQNSTGIMPAPLIIRIHRPIPSEPPSHVLPRCAAPSATLSCTSTWVVGGYLGPLFILCTVLYSVRFPAHTLYDARTVLRIRYSVYEAWTWTWTWTLTHQLGITVYLDMATLVAGKARVRARARASIRPQQSVQCAKSPEWGRETDGGR